jgi:hypothetical protein
VSARFDAFIAIDWSGAKGKKHKGIAIAEARQGTGAPRLVQPGHVWSRTEVLDWLLERAAAEPTLFGFDFSFAPPLIERGAYLPGEPNVPTDARAFWAYVDHHAPDEDLGATSISTSALPTGRRPTSSIFANATRRSTRRAAASPPLPMTRSAQHKSPRRASPECACFTIWTVR